jgi:hypothetical protein
MLLNDDDALGRINSPSNLLNKLNNIRNGNKNSSSLDIFINSKSKAINPFVSGDAKPVIHADENEITIDHIMGDADADIKLATAHTSAIDVMNSALEEMKLQISSMKPEKLPAVITAAGKIVTDIRKERIESQKNRTNQNVHFHFYTPNQKSLNDYSVIEVNSHASQ